MDRISPSEGGDAGSIPAERTKYKESFLTQVWLLCYVAGIEYRSVLRKVEIGVFAAPAERTKKKKPPLALVVFS